MRKSWCLNIFQRVLINSLHLNCAQCAHNKWALPYCYSHSHNCSQHWVRLRQSCKTNARSRITARCHLRCCSKAWWFICTRVCVLSATNAASVERSASWTRCIPQRGRNSPVDPRNHDHWMTDAALAQLNSTECVYVCVRRMHSIQLFISFVHTSAQKVKIRA